MTSVILVKDYTDYIADYEPSMTDTAKRSPGHIFLPKKIYETLPAAYVSAGTLFIVGAVYIGIGHGAMLGYLAVGLSCILAGVTVKCIRRRERST